MNDIKEIRYGCAGASFGFGASAVGICDIAPPIARMLGFFAGVAFLVCAITFFVEAALEKKNEPTPLQSEQAQPKENIEKIYDDYSIAENLGLVNGLEEKHDHDD